jgi:DNA-damage-inducible protein J
MAAGAVVRARIDEKTKKKATAVLKSMGLTPSDAVRMMMVRIATDKELPFTKTMPQQDAPNTWLAARLASGFKPVAIRGEPASHTILRERGSL